MRRIVSSLIFVLALVGTPAILAGNLTIVAPLLKKFEILERGPTLGAGTSGVVSFAEARLTRKDGSHLTEKVVCKSISKFHAEKRQAALQEFNWMLKVGYDSHFVKPYALIEGEEYVDLCMEYGGPTLKDYLKSLDPPYVPDMELVHIAIGVAESLKVLQQYEGVYRDLKPENVLYDPSTGTVRLIDLGSVRKIGACGEQSGSSSFTCAPENALGARLGSRSDIFSLGSMLYYLRHHGWVQTHLAATQFSNPWLTFIYMCSVNEKRSFRGDWTQQMEPEINRINTAKEPADAYEAIDCFIYQMLNPDEADRPSLDDTIAFFQMHRAP